MTIAAVRSPLVRHVPTSGDADSGDASPRGAFDRKFRTVTSSILLPVTSSAGMIYTPEPCELKYRALYAAGVRSLRAMGDRSRGTQVPNLGILGCSETDLGSLNGRIIV